MIHARVKRKHRRIGEGLLTQLGGKICCCDGGAAPARVKNIKYCRVCLLPKISVEHCQSVQRCREGRTVALWIAQIII